MGSFQYRPWWVRWIAIVLLVSGCATRGPIIDFEVKQHELPESVELTQTPFYPQEDYQCGPAALATLLVESGVDVDAQEMVAQVYIPERRGSLQIEMLAATRTAGRLAYLIQPEPVAVLAEIAAGRPVLVLQNVGLKIAPLWHYAVIVGYEAATNSLILRSGVTKRRIITATKFARSWGASDNWGMIALRPGEMPAMPIEADYLRAAAALEAVGHADGAQAAFAAAVDTWPESSAAWFGMANAHYASGDFTDAEKIYRQLLEWRPDDAAILNNLAQVLLDQNRCTEASETIGRASRQSLVFESQEAIADTRAAIVNRCDEKRSAASAGS
jgi:hypothetical protein